MAELLPGTARLSFFTRALLALFTVGLTGCDHATKIAAECALSGGRAVALAPGILELRYAPNPDTAFSLLRRFGVVLPPGLLVALAGAGLVGALVMWFASRRHATALTHLGFALVVAGALGNVADRAMRGYVVDFIHVTHWPVFNVADVAVVLGFVALALSRKRAVAATA